MGVHTLERENRHGERKNSGWHHWSKYAQRLEARCPHSALSALPEFEITAVSTSRQETADETAKHFGIPHAFAEPYKMVQHPDVDLVSVCVRVPFHHQLGMAALNAGKHLYCEWPLAATTEQAQQMRDLAVRKGSDR
jgi:predicted dehydrogenase